MRRALHSAIVDGIKGENLGALAEWKPGERNGWVTYDNEATRKNVEVARGVMAKLLRSSWGAASMTEGIFLARPTMRDLVRNLPFATPYTRKRIGKLWEFTTVEGSQAIVGRITDLLAANYEIVPDSALDFDNDLRGSGAR